MPDATLCANRPARLIRIAHPGLLVRLCPTLVAITSLVSRFLVRQTSPGGSEQFERQLHDHLREIGRVIVEWTYNHLEPDSAALMPRQIFYEGVYLLPPKRSVAEAVSLLPVRTNPAVSICISPFGVGGCESISTPVVPGNC